MGAEIKDEDIDRIVQQLQAEEAQAADARLSSYESFKAWIQTNPVLQQLGVVDAINQYGPAILELVRRVLGA